MRLWVLRRGPPFKCHLGDNCSGGLFGKEIDNDGDNRFVCFRSVFRSVYKQTTHSGRAFSNTFKQQVHSDGKRKPITSFGRCDYNLCRPCYEGNLVFEALEDVAEDIEAAGATVAVVPEDAAEVVGGEPVCTAVMMETES